MSAEVRAEETSSPKSDEVEPSATVDTGSIYIPDMCTAEEEDAADPFAIRLSRRGSNTSLHSRALTSEEGRLHRLSQTLRRDFLNPSLIAPEGGGAVVSGDDSHINALREKVENLKGDESMNNHVESIAADKAFDELVQRLCLQRYRLDVFEARKEVC